VPFGRHAATISLTGACTGSAVCEDLVAAVADAVEANRTGLVIDLRAATGLGADVLQTIRDIDQAGDRCGWRVVVVKPSAGPLRTLFFSEALDMGLTMATTRALALLWAMRVRPQAASA
jgi:hypothetical protein